MNSNFTRLIDIYSRVYDYTREIELLISVNNYDEINNLLNKREPILIEGESIRKGETFSDAEKVKIDELIVKLKKLDKQNSESILKKREILAKEFGEVVKNQKVVSAYRIKTETSSIIFDSKN